MLTDQIIETHNPNISEIKTDIVWLVKLVPRGQNGGKQYRGSCSLPQFTGVFDSPTACVLKVRLQM